MARVTGIGGIFLRARDPKSLTAWYAKHLGIAAQPTTAEPPSSGPTKSPQPPA